MSERASDYLERRARLAASRLGAIVRGLPHRIADTPELERLERAVVRHPGLVLGSTFAAATLLARSCFSSHPASDPAPAREEFQPRTGEGTATPDLAATDASIRHESPPTNLAAGLLTPLVAFASRAMIDVFFTAPRAVGGESKRCGDDSSETLPSPPQ